MLPKRRKENMKKLVSDNGHNIHKVIGFVTINRLHTVQYTFKIKKKMEAREKMVMGMAQE